MITQCPSCHRVYDDEYKLTLCPHRPLGTSGAYCAKHDLDPCPFCDPTTTNPHVRAVEVLRPWVEGEQQYLTPPDPNIPPNATTLPASEWIGPRPLEMQHVRAEVDKSCRCAGCLAGSVCLHLAREG